MKKLTKVKKELEYLKKLNHDISLEYGSELSVGNMVKREKELECEIEILEKEDTTMYLVKDFNSYKSANSVAIYSSKIGEGIHFNEKPKIYDGELIDSDDENFWAILKDESGRLTHEISNLRFQLNIAEKNYELIEKAYKRKEL